MSNASADAGERRSYRLPCCTYRRQFFHLHKIIPFSSFDI